jgi:hypothetical protein
MGVKYIRDSNDVRARQMWELRRAMAQATCYEDWTRASKQLDQLTQNHPACASALPRTELLAMVFYGQRVSHVWYDVSHVLLILPLG